MVNAREKLLRLVTENNKKGIDNYIHILSEMQTPKDIGRAMRSSGGSYGASYTQLFSPLMMNLYSQEESVKIAIRNEIRTKIGIPNETTDLYFTKYIEDGPFSVSLCKEMKDAIPENKRKSFIELTEQLMLDHLKSYAGIEKVVDIIDKKITT